MNRFLRLLSSPGKLQRNIKRKLALKSISELSTFVKTWSSAELQRSNYHTTFTLDPLVFKNLTHFQYISNIQFLEIGCFIGFTSNFLVDNFLQGSNSRLTCIDPWIEYSKSTENSISGFDNIINNDTFSIFEENTRRNADKICIHRGLSKDILPTLTTRFHFIFIDGDHSTSAVWKDALYSIRLLAKGGYILFDDYDWNQGKSNPKAAIEYFEFCFREKIQHIPTFNNQRLYRLAAELDSDDRYDPNYFN